MYPGHHFNNLSIKLGITSISALKEAVDHTTLDTAALRIKFAEQLRLVKALSSMNEEHADEVLINSTKYKVAQKATAQGKYAPVQGDEGPGQVFMYKSENQPSEKGSRRSSAASTPKVFFLLYSPMQSLPASVMSAHLFDLNKQCHRLEHLTTPTNVTNQVLTPQRSPSTRR